MILWDDNEPSNQQRLHCGVQDAQQAAVSLGCDFLERQELLPDQARSGDVDVALPILSGKETTNYGEKMWKEDISSGWDWDFGCNGISARWNETSFLQSPSRLSAPWPEQYRELWAPGLNTMPDRMHECQIKGKMESTYVSDKCPNLLYVRKSLDYVSDMKPQIEFQIIWQYMSAYMPHRLPDKMSNRMSISYARTYR